MDDLDGDSSVNEPSALSKKFAAIGHVRREMSATNVCVPAVFCLAYQPRDRAHGRTAGPGNARQGARTVSAPG